MSTPLSRGRSTGKSRTALVAGASGLVGSFLLPRLLDDSSYDQVKVLTRRQLHQHHAKLVALERTDGAFDQLGDALAADDVFCCLGTRLASEYERVDYQLVVDLACSARSAGARQFIVLSALGTSQNSLLRYFRVKARMEATLSGLDYPTVQVVRPSLLLGDREEAGVGERLAFKLAATMSPIMGGSLKKARPIHATDVAAAMIDLAKQNVPGTHVHHLPLENFRKH